MKPDRKSPSRWVAFDIETAKEVPGTDFNWKPHRPLGISCAAALATDAAQPQIWHGTGQEGRPAARLSREEAAQIVRELTAYVERGYTLVTWNGLGFDFDVLAEESGLTSECRMLALDHVDMMFHVFCDRGFPVALAKAAEGQAIAGKPGGMTGLVAPQLWAQGRHQEVLDYVAHDVRIALSVAIKCEQSRRFSWITQKGAKSSLDLQNGWLRVRDAMKLPLPDTSWMSRPLKRQEFSGWLDIK